MSLSTSFTVIYLCHLSCNLGNRVIIITAQRSIIPSEIKYFQDGKHYLLSFKLLFIPSSSDHFNFQILFLFLRTLTTELCQPSTLILPTPNCSRSRVISSSMPTIPSEEPTRAKHTSGEWNRRRAMRWSFGSTDLSSSHSKIHQIHSLQTSFFFTNIFRNDESRMKVRRFKEPMLKMCVLN